MKNSKFGLSLPFITGIFCICELLLFNLLLEVRVQFVEAVFEDKELVDRDLCRLIFFVFYPGLVPMESETPQLLVCSVEFETRIKVLLIVLVFRCVPIF